MDNFNLRKYLGEGKLIKEAKEIDMEKSFLENKGLKVEVVKSLETWSSKS